MKLSCLIPNYNDSATLAKSVNAMLSQPIKEMEIIIIDDGSTDDSYSVIAELAAKDSRIKVIKHSQNQGVVATLLHGLALVQGELIYMGSANDTVCSGFFEKAISTLNSMPSIGLFCGNALLDNGTDQIYSDLGWGQKERCFTPEDVHNYKRIKTCCFHGQSVIFRKACLAHFGELSADLKSNFDLFIFFVIAFRFGFAFSPEAYAIIEMAEDNFSAREKKLKDKMSKTEVFLRNLDLPCYSDIKQKIISSGLLSFLGIPLICLIISKKRWHYFSWPLTKDLIRQNWRKVVRKIGV